MNVKNLPFYAFIGIIAVFTIGYFITAYNISFAFQSGNDDTSYDYRMTLIKKTSELYGENNPDKFEDKDSIYITVDDLIEAGYLSADNDEGEYKDPTSEVLTLNELKIRITNKDGAIEAKILD